LKTEIVSIVSSNWTRTTDYWKKGNLKHSLREREVATLLPFKVPVLRAFM